MAIADSGYVYDFLFYSLKYKTVELQRYETITLTSSAVLQLAKSLPYDSNKFSIFLDNLFSEPRLFLLLRNLGIGANGTCRKEHHYVCVPFVLLRKRQSKGCFIGTNNPPSQVSLVTNFQGMGNCRRLYRAEDI